MISFSDFAMFKKYDYIKKTNNFHVWFSVDKSDLFSRHIINNYLKVPIVSKVPT